jgi:glycosyltransferase involved in cell wall biosynthesis
MGGLLAATLIVRDEAAVLERCLSSIQGVVDEIIVVDTGSRDESIAIAKRFGARVEELAWTGDFAQARNAALDLTDAEWILYIDADEHLAPVERAEVEALLADAPEASFRLLLQPHVGSTPYREYRLWRHDPRVRFEGVIHEKVVPAIQRVAEEDGRPIGVCDLLLVHDGYEGDQTHKHRRNMPLLRRQLANEPDNLFNLHHLARTLTGLGEAAEAREVLEHAVDVVRGGAYDEGVGALAYGDLVRMRLDLGEDDVAPLLEESRSRYPGNYQILFQEARFLTESEEYEQAIDRFETLVAVDLKGLVDQGPSYDERIFGLLAYDGMGLCLFRLGRNNEAAQAYAQAQRYEPENASFEAKRQVALARAKGSGA